MRRDIEMPDRKPVTLQEPAPVRAQSPYRLREHFLSTPERALLRALQKMAGERYLICPKVALNDIFYIVRPNENVHFFNKFFRKHVDFLLCDLETFKPAIGIELVKPVSRTERRELDQFMMELFLSARLPLVYVQSSEHYTEKDLTTLLELAVIKVKETGPLRATTKTDSVPMCPVCGKMMVLRFHREGRKAGRKYYGCVDSPSCRGTVVIG
jgi:predicted RNA-binding Zn-ribbon protein involved in translation (DUF1610 family)